MITTHIHSPSCYELLADGRIARICTPDPPYRHAPTCPMSQREPVDWPPIGTVPPSLDEPDKARTERVANLAALRELLGHLRNTEPDQEEWIDALAWAINEIIRG